MDFDKRELGQQDSAPEIVKFSDTSANFNVGVFFVYMAAVLAIAATAYFWFGNKSLANTLTEKNQEKDKIVAEITSPTYKDVETTAINFKSAVSALKLVAKDRYSMTDFLSELYKYLDKDVKISSLSISEAGLLTVAGSTGSYRAAADQVLALNSWKVLSSVELGAVSLSIDESGNATVPVSITANIDKSAKLIEEPVAESAQ